MREYEILMLLREAYRFIGRENRRGYQRCMEQAKAAMEKARNTKTTKRQKKNGTKTNVAGSGGE